MSRAVGYTDSAELQLPSSLVSLKDIARIIRELETVDNALEQQRARGVVPLVLPALSGGLAALCEHNRIDLADDNTRLDLHQRLARVKEEAPVMHITFASEVEPDVLAQLVGWIRSSLHPRALVTVGLQPTIVGGCVVRTPDHIYDFSLRERFQQHRDDFVRAVQERLNAVAVPTAEGASDGQ